MKKNKMMRIAGILLIAVLLTTSLISGTFAKYVTRGEVEDHARVAKFGVTISGSGKLFAETYYHTTNNRPADGVEDSANGHLITVASSNGDEIVAPGTKSDPQAPFTVSVSGAPEVDVLITLGIAADSKDIYLKAGYNYPDRTTQAIGDTFTFEEDYYPIVYTLKLGNKVLASGNLAAIEEFLKDYSLYVDTTKELNAENYTYTLSWEWAFESDADAVAEIAGKDFDDAIAADSHTDKRVEYNGVRYWENPSKTQLGREDYIAARVADAKLLRDQQDTLLGDLAAKAVGLSEGEYNLTTSVTLTVTVTQVD